MTRRNHIENNAAARKAGGVMILLARFWRERGGNIAPIVALLAVPLIASMAVGTEASNWFFTYRSEQNAADSAAIAAGNAGSSGYLAAGQAVAAQYGFVDGSNNTSVSVSNAATCPAGGTGCYSVTITRKLPIYLTAVLGPFGYRGDTTTSTGGEAKQVRALAVVGTVPELVPDCIIALGTNTNDMKTDGTPSTNLNGCNVQSNSTSTGNGSNAAVQCTGQGIGAGVTIAAGSITGSCGVTNISGGAAVADPYSGLASHIDPDPCPALTGGSVTSATYAGSSTPTLQPNGDGTYYVCGTWTPASAPSTAPGYPYSAITSSMVVTIYNGALDIGTSTLATSGSGGLSVIFTGSGYSYTSPGTDKHGNPITVTTTVSPCQKLVGSGTLNIAATIGGTWSGIGLYQAPSLSDVSSCSLVENGSTTSDGASLDFTAAGSAPTFEITGVYYSPNGNVTISGAIDKASSGSRCFILAVNTITINGNGSILADSQSGCVTAGVTQVQSMLSRVALLQ
jgi:Flp pilus assembly protein TadG